MGFWIFSLFENSIIPILMTVTGIIFTKRIPKKDSGFTGYKTAMSTKNDDTWEFANSHIGKVFRIAGPVMLILSLVATFFAFGKDTHIIGNFILVIGIIQIIVLIGSIVLTEIALRKNFDKNGRRK
ncbi:hypothetical protein CCDG5_0078 [[Clostridium] cellulosi]|uniref:SdpI/YhfL protein family n=1 Tax=[Clostridium] cellulosi TaxID=29343 RepID=A0A078KL80_9FIRM|nr:hypothetical protein CCDG5_0078 [[Clostridium] cellulosi]